ncbi:MAG: hypothetical protein HY722_10835 [Planctomycetes bacterium]|nr:hypothetical protein [Planctomycetota bacterium]
MGPDEGTTAGSPATVRRIAAWTRWLTVLTVGGFLFLAASGLVVWQGAATSEAQMALVAHTVLGALWMVPVAWYLVRHVGRLLYSPLSVGMALGYLGLAAVMVSLASGLVTGTQALFGPRMGETWERLHRVSSLAANAVLPLHLAWVAVRGLVVTETALRRWTASAILRSAVRALAVALVACLPVAVWRAAYRASGHEVWRLPEGYSRAYGENPFAPSLARTTTGGAVDPRALSGSARCGSAGCHTEIYEEWSVSAHRWSSMDLAFRSVQEVMARENGAEATRYCAGCHDPVALFAGAKDATRADLSCKGADEGVSCAACHAIQETDVRGNADYVVAAPPRYVHEGATSGVAARVTEFLVRAWPAPHRAAYTRPLQRTAEYCAACHKQFVDEQVNNFGWVQLQNQYDNWRKSHWNHAEDPSQTLACRDCHMRLVDGSSDPAAGDAADAHRTPRDGRHRSHRFIAANQVMPHLLRDALAKGHPSGRERAGALVDEQLRLTGEWLAGRTEIPEIRERWAAGAVIPLAIES